MISSVLTFAIISAPAVPSVIQPVAGQVNVNEHPSFVLNGCDVATCRLVIDTNPACTGASKIFNNIRSNNFTITDGVNLEFNTTFYACLNATDATGTSAQSSPSKFTTRGVAVAPAALTVNVRSSIQQPSGQSQILLSGTNGEPGATARIYMKRSAGDELIGSTPIVNDAVGSFSLATDATLDSIDSGSRIYYAVIERRDKSTSAPSNAVTFYYDQKYSLPAPVIQPILDINGERITGALKWTPVNGVTGYEIYRRIAKEGCSPSGTVACYLNKPFMNVFSYSSKPIPSADGMIHFIDATIGNIANGEGVSYFVIAVKSDTDQRSARSNAVSFKDITAPQRSAFELLQIVATKTGRSVQVFYSNIDSAGFLNADNFPDLSARVQYFSRANDPACPATTGDFKTAFANKSKGGIERSLAFDALNSYTDFSSSIENWVFAGELSDLDPDTAYCFQVCLKDEARIESSCSVGSARTLFDTVAPQFNGVTSATPLSNGRSVQVKWSLAKEDQTSREVIQYQIQQTTQFDRDSAPVFKDLLSDKDIVVVQSGANSAILDNLQTGTRYCFQATAVDNALPNSNRNTPSGRWQCTTTFDNRPVAQNISIGSAITPEPYRIPISFIVIDREAEIPGHRVSLDSIYFRLNNAEWTLIEPANITGNFDNLKASSSVNNASPNEIIFDTLPYFSGEQQIEFKIKLKDFLQVSGLSGNASTQIISNSAETQSSGLIIFPGMASISSFQNQTLSGCELNIGANGAVPISVVLAFALCAFAALLLRRSLRN
jgi:hypothetical protein